MIMGRRMVSGLIAVVFLMIMVHSSTEMASAAERKYPSKPIEIVCGYPPGGAMDLTMRLWAKYLEKRLGVPVVPVNKPGAGAILACTYIAGAQPDGYTLGAVGDHLVINIIAGRAKYTLDDFRYVCLATYIANVLAVPVDSQWKTIQDFMEYAKKNPGVKYAHPGIGSSNHIRVENFNKVANLKMTAVAFNGDAEAIPAVLGKHVAIASLGAAAAKAQADAGKLRILMSFDPPAEIGIDPKTPDWQTVFGKNVADIDIGSYLVVPKKTPDHIVKLLEQTMEEITKDPEFRKEFWANNMKVGFVDSGTLMKKVLPEKNAHIQTIMKETGQAK
jgi:tripartite-type tricarboxylate transporter receptor subunit TctC